MLVNFGVSSLNDSIASYIKYLGVWSETIRQLRRITIDVRNA